MINLRFPNINGRTEAEQLIEIKNYLWQLVEELNYALAVIERDNTEKKGERNGHLSE